MQKGAILSRNKAYSWIHLFTVNSVTLYKFDFCREYKIQVKYLRHLLLNSLLCCILSKCLGSEHKRHCIAGFHYSVILREIVRIKLWVWVMHNIASCMKFVLFCWVLWLVQKTSGNVLVTRSHCRLEMTVIDLGTRLLTAMSGKINKLFTSKSEPGTLGHGKCCQSISSAIDKFFCNETFQTKTINLIAKNSSEIS